MKKNNAQRKYWQLEERVQKKVKGRDTYISQLKAELKDAENGIELQRAALQKSLEKRGREVQGQREKAEEYFVRMRAAESKLMSLQRNHIVFKAQKQREVDQIQRSMNKILPSREEPKNKVYPLDVNGSQIDMDSTLELDNELSEEEKPFVLRNALITEKRKVKHLTLVKKELEDAYYHLAEQKQKWVHEKVVLIARIKSLEVPRTGRRKYKSDVLGTKL